MALYQTYRPKDFHSLFGQPFVREVLQNALLQNRTVGAYLFHGSRGTGKTTVARILAKWVNCLSLTLDGNPCSICQNCRDAENGSLLDIIEIDAASNTGVDNIREIIERAQFQPTQAPYKVYIIDEVHMLSKGAFNALLKTLEEPPKHVKFILATTEIQKIPDTIISRSQRYDFKRIKNEDIIERLHFIAHSEQIEAEESALELIAKLAKWGLRDAITIFEQYSVWGILKRKYIEDNLELIWEDFLLSFTESLLLKDTEKILKDLDILREKSLDVRLFLEQLLFFLRDCMRTTLNTSSFRWYTELFNVYEGIYGRLKFSPDPFLLLETSTFRCLTTTQIWSIIQNEVPVSTKTPMIPKKPIIITWKESEKIVPLESVTKEIENREIIPEISPIFESSNQNVSFTQSFDFSRFIEHIRSVPKRSFVGLWLRVSTYSIDGNTIVIHPDNDFNHKKLDSTDVRLFLQEILDQLFGVGFLIDIRKGGGLWLTNKRKTTLAEDASDIF